jgi:hypothetical protein
MDQLTLFGLLAVTAMLAISPYHQRLGLPWLKLTEGAGYWGCSSIFSESSILM